MSFVVGMVTLRPRKPSNYSSNMCCLRWRLVCQDVFLFFFHCLPLAFCYLVILNIQEGLTLASYLRYDSWLGNGVGGSGLCYSDEASMVDILSLGLMDVIFSVFLLFPPAVVLSWTVFMPLPQDVDSISCPSPRI